jgi:hypothetical protein
LELDVEETRQAGNLHLSFEAPLYVFFSLDIPLIIQFGWIACFNSLQKSERLGRIDRQIIFFPYIGTEQIEPVAHVVMIEGFTEAILQGFVIHAYDERVSASCEVVR